MVGQVDTPSQRKNALVDEENPHADCADTERRTSAEPQPAEVRRVAILTAMTSDQSTVDGGATVRVVIADDHAIVRRGLRQLLEAEDGFEVVAEAEDIESARRYVRGHHPDVLVLDLNMPGEPSLEAIPKLREEFPETQIVVLTMQDEPAYARTALSAGVLGYVLKEAADAELVEAIRAAVEGEQYLNPRLGAKVAAEPPSGSPDGLSERELQVIKLIALGHTNAQVAETLFLSVRTVETHRAHIQQKLELGDRSDLVRYALDKGLLS